MKKPFLLFVFALVLGTFQWAFAAPLKNIPVRLTQPDGQVIECFASGDEFYNYLHDANGFTIVKGEGGYYCYATTTAKAKWWPPLIVSTASTLPRLDFNPT